jgi:hypothetical protein
MRKQILKGLMMLLAIMSLAMITAVASANAQSSNSRANVPFDFVVGSTTLPSGAYTVDAITSTGETLRISSTDSEKSAVRLTQAVAGNTSHAKLVFHRYGQRYFLAEVWTNEGGRQLTMSKDEKAIQLELSRIASGKPATRDYERVEIAIAKR